MAFGAFFQGVFLVLGWLVCFVCMFLFAWFVVVCLFNLASKVFSFAYRRIWVVP